LLLLLLLLLLFVLSVALLSILIGLIYDDLMIIWKLDHLYMFSMQLTSEILVLNFIHSPRFLHTYGCHGNLLWIWPLRLVLNNIFYQLNCLDHYTHAIDLWSIKFHVWPLRRLHIYSNKLWRMWPTRFIF